MNGLYAYFRVSTDLQTEDMQVDAVRGLVEQMNHDWNDVTVLKDHAVSGRSNERENYRKLLDLIVDDKVKKLFIYDYSRAWRDIEEQSRALKLFSKFKVSVFAVHGGHITEHDAESKLRANLQGVVNEYEADKFAERRADGVSAKHKKCLEIMIRAKNEGWSVEQLREHPDFWGGRGKDKKSKKKY